MKRAISILLVFVLAVSFMGASASSAGFAVDGIRGITVPAVAGMTAEVNTGDEAALKAFRTLLEGSVAVSSVPETAVETATFRAVQSGDKTVEYTLLTDGGSLYLRRGSQTRSITAEALNDFTNTLDKGLYLCRTIPTAKSGELVLKTRESSYAYRKLNGIYYRPSLPGETENPVISAKVGTTPAITFSAKDKYTVVALYKGSEKVWEGDLPGMKDFVPAAGGDYTMILSVGYEAENLYRGIVSYTAVLRYPEQTNVSFAIEGSSSYPGEFVVLRAYNLPQGEKIAFTSNIDDFKPAFFRREDGSMIALLPIHYRNQPAKYTVTMSAAGQSQSFAIDVRDKQFQIQNLTADQNNVAETVNSQKANDEFEEKIAPIRFVADETPYFLQNDFIWPLAAGTRVTTQFGMIRYVNGSPTSVRHGAIDFAAPLGTSIAATNNGRVLFAGFLQLTGNTVVIEHGYGLKSWHYHMDSLSVKTGDMVTVGQKLGTVGTTGFSTGPHLHFGFSVNNVFINPTTVIDGSLLELNK